MFEDNKSFYFTPNAFLLIFLRFLLHLWFSIMFQIMAHYFVTPSFAACFLLALSLIFCLLLTEHLFLFGSFILFSSFYQHFFKRKCGYQISTVAMGTEGSEEKHCAELSTDKFLKYDVALHVSTNRYIGTNMRVRTFSTAKTKGVAFTECQLSA